MPCILVGLSSRILNFGNASATTATVAATVTTTANNLFPVFKRLFCGTPYKLCTNK